MKHMNTRCPSAPAGVAAVVTVGNMSCLVMIRWELPGRVFLRCRRLCCVVGGAMLLLAFGILILLCGRGERLRSE